MKNSRPPADSAPDKNPALAPQLGPDASGKIGTRYSTALLYTPSPRFALACCRLRRLPISEDSNSGTWEDFFLALREADQEHFDIRDIPAAAAIIRGDTENHGQNQLAYRLRILSLIGDERQQIKDDRNTALAESPK